MTDAETRIRSILSQLQDALVAKDLDALTALFAAVGTDGLRHCLREQAFGADELLARIGPWAVVPARTSRSSRQARSDLFSPGRDERS
jgi:hypothetical protein